MSKKVFAPADNIADSEMYLRLAADMDSRIAELKARFKATGDMKFYYRIQPTSIPNPPCRRFWEIIP